MNRACILALALAIAGLGCFRTHYENFSPKNPIGGSADAHKARATGWQHFFLFGWVPQERFIDARQICGGPEHIVAIETRQTFLEGLVASLAGYYINIYSPWDGAVLCDEPRRR
jgi:hypothetical protein